MNTPIKILLVTAIAAAFTLTARAGDQSGPALSPKAQQLQDGLRRTTVSEADMLDRSVKAGSPKEVAMQESLRRSPVHETDMIARNETPGNARALAYSSARAATWGNTYYVAPTK